MELQLIVSKFAPLFWNFDTTESIVPRGKKDGTDLIRQNIEFLEPHRREYFWKFFNKEPHYDTRN